MPSQPFFSFDIHQQVNQWICMAFVALLGFLVVLYYLVNRAEAFGNAYVAATVTIDQPAKHHVIQQSQEQE